RAGELLADCLLLLVVDLLPAGGVAHQERHVERWREGRRARVHDGDDVHPRMMPLRQLVRDARRRERTGGTVRGEEHRAAGEIERAERLGRCVSGLVRVRVADRRDGVGRWSGHEAPRWRERRPGMRTLAPRRAGRRQAKSDGADARAMAPWGWPRTRRTRVAL